MDKQACIIDSSETSTHCIWHRKSIGMVIDGIIPIAVCSDRAIVLSALLFNPGSLSSFVIYNAPAARQNRITQRDGNFSISFQQQLLNVMIESHFGLERRSDASHPGQPWNRRAFM
jgi:hypothetical protein